MTIWTLPGHGDELALAAHGRLWVAASTSTMAFEEVWAGEVTPSGDVVDPVRVAELACRPAIAALDAERAVVVACTPGPAIAGALVARGRVQRWTTALEGRPRHVSCAVNDDTAWLAIELASDGDRRIAWCTLDPETGTLRQYAELGMRGIWCRWPAVVADGRPVLAWSEGPARAPGTIRVAHWERTFENAVSIDTGESPALAILSDRVAVAWHRGGPTASAAMRDASVVRAIDVALVAPDGSWTIATPPDGPAPAGEDQGWELPALAAADGELWLVGRSTHGHHLACRDAQGTWTRPASLCDGAWGGRGRRHALARFDGATWLARKTPSGVALAPCVRPHEVARTPAPRPAPSVRHVAPIVERIRFGDLHQHTAHSDGCGSLEDLWIAARDHRGLDFAAITDHDQFCRRAIGPATWQLSCQIAGELHEPGRFVALPAYELTGPRHPGPGHKCVYFGDRVPERVPDRDLDALFAMLRDVGGIAVPHHVGWTGGDFSHHDPAVQPVWEICSVHGCYEAEGGCAAHPPRADHVIPGQFVRDALAAGLRFGFIASTDSHGLDWHHGIARWRNPFHAGLACLVDADLTRDGVLDAIRQRRTYATTGARIGLRVELDGAPMGSEVSAAGGELLVEIEPTAAITRVVLVHADGEDPLAFETIGSRARIRTRVPVTARYLYVRVEQTDGELAWSSPCWQPSKEST